MMTQQEMTMDEAVRLLQVSREMHWSFPTSQGRPVRWDSSEEWVQQIILKKRPFVEAARFFLDNGKEDMATELAANAWRLWILSRDIEEGRQFLAEVLDRSPGKISRARSLALYGAGLLAFRRGRLEESDKRNQEALAVAEQTKDLEGLGLAHLGLSRIAFERRDFERAQSHAVKARELLKGLAPEYGQAPLFLHAQSVRMLRDYEAASSLFEQSLALNRRMEDKGMVIAELTNLGRVEIHRGNADIAEQYFNEAEKIAGTSDAYDMAMNLVNKAALAFLRGDPATAQSLLHWSRAALKESGIELGPDDKYDIDWLTQKIEENSRS